MSVDLLDAAIIGAARLVAVRPAVNKVLARMAPVQRGTGNLSL